MADRHSPDNIDRELEDLLTSHRDQIAYPEMADSVSTARQRIESADRPLAVGNVLDTSPLDDWDDDREQINGQGSISRIDRQAPGRLRQLLTLAAAALAIFIVGGVLIAVLPDVINDESQSGAVLGPDTTGYEFAGTIGGPMIPNEPVDVAVDSQGNIYAADIATRSVHKFDPEGTHLTSWAAEDAEVGPFIRPWSLAIEDDTLYVLDQGQAAIYRMDTQGNVLNSWRVGNPQDSTSLFTGIDVNQHGHAYVANANGGSIVVYDEKGSHLADIQITNDPLSGGERPLDVAVRDDGRIFVTSFTGNEVRILDSTGAELDRILSSDLGEMGFPGPPQFYGVTVGDDGSLYTRSATNVTQFDAYTFQTVAGWDFQDNPGNITFPPQGIAVDYDGVIYISDTSNQKIIGYAIGSTDPMIEIEDTRTDRFSTPGGVKVDDEGSIYVTDSAAQQVTKFAPDGTILNNWTWETDSVRIGSSPGDVAVTGDHLYILDGHAPSIVKLALTGEKIHEWTGAPMGPDEWNRPMSVHTDSESNLYLLNQGLSILKYSPDGAFLEQLAHTATDPERQDPLAMTIENDMAYVAIGGSMPGIWTLDLDGNPIQRIVEFTIRDDGAPATFVSSLAVAPTGDIFTVDPFSQSARWYSPAGELKSEWSLDTPASDAPTHVAIAVSDTGTVYVSDGNTRQVLVYEPVSE